MDSDSETDSYDSDSSANSDMESDSETDTSYSDSSTNSNPATDPDSSGSDDMETDLDSTGSEDSDTETTITLYHYTSKAGAKGIRDSGVIEASTSRNDAAYGEGVYFTSIDPYHEPEDILWNNYDDGGNVINSSKFWKKIEWVVEVEMPDGEAHEVDDPENRDIFLYPGYELVLREYNHKIYKNPGY